MTPKKVAEIISAWSLVSGRSRAWAWVRHFHSCPVPSLARRSLVRRRL